MKTIAVMSPKGGIGKTTTADSIAYILGEEHGKRILLVDGDPQGDTSKTLGRYEPEGIGLNNLLEHHESMGGKYRTTDIIKATEYQHIDIITANGYLYDTHGSILRAEGAQITRFREALENVSGAYDYCICDCGRFFDMVVVNLLIASELVVAPVKVGGYENEAIHSLKEQVEDLQKINQTLKIKGLMTMRMKNKTTIEFEEWMKTQSGFRMFQTPIRRSIIAERAAIAMQPLPKFSPKSIAAQDYRSVVAEILEDMEGREE